MLYSRTISRSNKYLANHPESAGVIEYGLRLELLHQMVQTPPSVRRSFVFLPMQIEPDKFMTRFTITMIVDEM